MKKKVGFIEQVDCLIDRFVSLKGKKDMKVVCVIDDLDLISNKYIVKEIEMLSKFIAYTKLVVILAYRPKQLENTLLAEKINENKILLDENVININELEDRVNNQLSKLIPHNHQISLPEQSVTMAKPMYDYLEDFLIKGRDTQEIRNLLTSIDLSGKKHYDRLSVKDWLNKAIFNATGLTFEPTKNNEFYDNFFTKNLRDLLQFLKIIFDMDTFENDSNINSVELRDVLTKKLKNIEKLESYLNLRVKNVLPSNLIEIYKKIRSSDIREHNYVVYREIFNLLDMLDNKINNRSIDTYKNSVFQNYILKINYISSENVSLGDVLNIIDILEFSYQRFLENNNIYKLIYFIKINYSILLMKNILEVIYGGDNKEKIQISKNNYTLLLNGKITTSFIAYNKSFRKPFIWPSKNKDSDTTILLRYVLPYMVYTNRSSLGSQTREVLSSNDVMPSLFNRRYFINAVSKEENNIKYWNLRNSMMKFEMPMVTKRNYNLDPLAYLTHQDYIEEQIEIAREIFTNITDDEKKLGYLVTDVFQLDLINAYNYADDSKDTWANYTLGRIDDYLSYQEEGINREASMLADCFQSLFAYKGENFKYVTPYSSESFKRRLEENYGNNKLEDSFENVINLLNGFSNEAEQKELKSIIENINEKGIAFSERKEYLKKLAPAKNEKDIAIYNDLTRDNRSRVTQKRFEKGDIQGMLKRAILRNGGK